MPGIIPDRQLARADWMKHLAIVVGANPSGYFLDNSTVTSLTSAVNTFVSALDVVNNPATKTKTTVADKNTAERAAMAVCRVVIGAVRPNDRISDGMKLAAGIPPLPNRTRHGAPTVEPGMEVLSVSKWTMLLNIHDKASPTKRGKPANVKSAFVYTFVGDTYPPNPELWEFNGAATRSKYEVTFPTTVPPGSTVWVCAAWVNARGETGPISTPISVNIQGGGVSAKTGDLKIAA